MSALDRRLGWGGLCVGERRQRQSFGMCSTRSERKIGQCFRFDKSRGLGLFFSGFLSPFCVLLLFSIVREFTHSHDQTIAWIGALSF